MFKSLGRSAFVWLLGLALVRDVTAQTIEARLKVVIEGEIGEKFGALVSPAGDLDGDGVIDVVVGAPWYTSPFTSTMPISGLLFNYNSRQLSGWNGRIRSRLGEVAGPKTQHEFEAAGSAFAYQTISGTPFTYSRALGAPWHSGTAGFKSGRVEFCHGNDGSGRCNAQAAWSVEGENARGEFGSALTSFPDVNWDGLGDYVVGAPGIDPAHPERLPRVYFLDGYNKTFERRGTSPILRVLEGDSAERRFGSKLSLAGDVDVDGLPEVLIAAPPAAANGTGRLYMYSYQKDTFLWTVDGAGAGEFAAAVAALGDVNRDGVPDVAVGTRRGGALAAGKVDVLSGASGTLLWSRESESPDYTDFGTVLSTIGDLNADGARELIVGSPREANGRVHVLSGATGDTLLTLPGFNHWYFRNYGLSAAGIGDVDGNGLEDIIVGTEGNASCGSRPEVFIYLLGPKAIQTDCGNGKWAAPCVEPSMMEAERILR